MRFLLLFGLLSTKIWAAEVATLQPNRTTKELQISLTDEALFISAEKHFMTQPCRLRSSVSISSNMREILVPEICRAQITKYLLNAGYKAIDARTFYR